MVLQKGHNLTNLVRSKKFKEVEIGKYKVVEKTQTKNIDYSFGNMVFSKYGYIKDFNYGQIEYIKNSAQQKYDQYKDLKSYNVKYFYVQVELSKYGNLINLFFSTRYKTVESQSK